MARRRYYRQRSYYRSNDYGRERARRHIEEAQEFSREIGGTDEDVKQYFFSLSGYKLEGILTEYGRKYGKSAEDYARKTIPLWRSGKRHMAGVVAKRLFTLLPPKMPLDVKFRLAENVWKHFGPSSFRSFMIGPRADAGELAEIVGRELDEQVVGYSIPENVQNRFSWLAAGDVQLKEQLLNHFRQLQKGLAISKIRNDISALQQRFETDPGTFHHSKSTINVHQHQITVWIDKALDNQIREGAPRTQYRASNESNYLWWIIGAIIVLAYLFL